MSFPDTIDFDKVANHALSDAGGAMNAWIKGSPRSEEAFLNQLTGKLGRNRRGCDVGVRQRVDMAATQYMLHREGDKQVDAFGADLAVTIIVHDSSRNNPYVKTSFFQLKKSASYEVKVEESQIDDAEEDSRIFDRSYVLSVDEVRKGFRLKEIEEVQDQFDDQNTKTFYAWDWTCLTNWIHDWFSCDEGPESDPDDPDSVESLLEAFVIEDEVDGAWATSSSGDMRGALPENAAPARTWLILEFEQVEEK